MASKSLLCVWLLVLVVCPASIGADQAEDGGIKPEERVKQKDDPEVEQDGGFKQNEGKDEDWGDGLKVLRTYVPESCEHKAGKNDIIHYHYVGRLAKDGSIFGRSFDYNSPYIVALGHGRIIPGMDRGLVGTCLWERRRISFPPHLGYGARGVGETIPPDSSLVFYIRLIKIERNGHVLGEIEDISKLWSTGLDSYGNQDWYKAVDMMEEAVRLHALYKNKTLSCVKKCDRESRISSLSQKKKKVLEAYQDSDPLVEHFVQYGLKGKCISDCKSESLPPKLQTPDPLLIEEFNRYVPYSFLHFSYYKLEEFDIATRCCFTFLHYNPNDELASSSIDFYRTKLGLSEGEYIYREPEIVSHQESYLKGREAYFDEKWLEAKDHFENSLEKFKTSLSDCYFLCEDVVNVNLTQPDMTPSKKTLLEEYGFKSDTMEYFELLGTTIKQVLSCRDKCYDRALFINGVRIDDYLNLHFDFLQFTYFKLGKLNDAAKAATTFLAIDPSSETMTSNIRFYSNEYEVSPEYFVEDEEYVYIHKNHEANQRLLYFGEHGEMKKKQGRKGDTGNSIPVTHEEL